MANLGGEYVQAQTDPTMAANPTQGIQPGRKPGEDDLFMAMAQALARKQFLHGPAGRMWPGGTGDDRRQMMLRWLFPTQAGTMRMLDPLQLTPPPAQTY